MKQNHIIREIIHELEARVRSNRRWRVVATCLASVVVFTTVYLLVLPAITMETSDDVPGIEALGEEATLTYYATDGTPASSAEEAAELSSRVSSGDVSNGDAPASNQDGAGTGATTDDGAADVTATDPSNPADENNVTSGSGSNAATDTTQGGPSSANDVDASGSQMASNSETPVDAQGAAANGADVSMKNDGISTLASGQVLDSGTFQSGDLIPLKLTWTLSLNDAGERVLTISGNGAIPDYSSHTQTPWYNATHHNLHDIVIEDGVTRVGNYAFSNLYAGGGLSLGADVTEIGFRAFETNYFDDPITVPGTVKTVGDFAFAGDMFVPEITFEEGVVSIGTNTLQSSLSATGVVNIPSSMTTFAASTCNAAAYNVAEGNPKYLDQDGVLYSKNADGTWKLERFPRNKELDTFTVPDKVTAINGVALQYVNNVRVVEIPDTVNALIRNGLFRNSNFQEITIGNGAKFESTSFQFLFTGCQKLERLELPDDISPANSMTITFQNNYLLQEITIPKNITSFWTGDPFSGTSSLERLVYNAEHATEYPKSVNGGKGSYVLTIGSDVDYLGAGFSVFSTGATSVFFGEREGEDSVTPNLIEVEEGAFEGLPIPLNSVSGLIWVDDQGAVYTLDEQTHEAALVYVPSGLARARIIDPLRVKMDNGQTVAYTVTSVKQNALAQASDLEIISFDAPENIKVLEAYALGNCPSLQTVRTFGGGDSATDIDAATKLFSNAKVDENAFFNSGLSDAPGGDFEDSMTGGQSLTVSADGASDMNISVDADGSPTATWTPNANSDGGGWTLLTGATLKVNATVGNTAGNSNYVYRVFVRRSSLQGTVGAEPGTSTSYEGQTVYCRATDDPYVICFEFVPVAEGTISFPIDTSYASPNTPGGGVVIWGTIEEGGLTEGDTVAVKEPDSWNDALYAFWKTEPNTFQVKKASKGDATIDIAGDGEGTVHPASGLTWTISHEREGNEDSSYGKDNVVSYDITDTITDLPAGVSWNPDVINAIKKGEVSYFTSGSITTFSASGIDIATVTTSGGGAAVNMSLALNDKGTPVFSWTKRNTSGTPIGSAPMTFPTHDFTILPEALVVNMEEYDSTVSNQVVNTVDSTVHYHWRKDDRSNATATKSLGEGTASLELTKTSGGASYFGEDIDYTVMLKNTGADTFKADASGSWTLVDTLSEGGYLYLKPKNIEALFGDCPTGVEVAVRIEGALLQNWVEVPDAVDSNETAYKTPGNTTGMGGTNAHTLVITKTGEDYQLTIDGTDSTTDTSVAKLLQDAGYDVTEQAKYYIEWTLNDKDTAFTAPGGKVYEFEVHATAKTTFELVGADWPYEYASGESNVVTPINEVDLYDENGPVNAEGGPNEAYKHADVKNSLRREATIHKEVYDEEGNDLSGGFVVNNNDVISYEFTFEHFGTGSYDNLPFVDDIYGTQALLVEKNLNPGLEGKDLEEVTRDEVNYYILNKPDTYKNVVVGSEANGTYWTAATVEVERSNGTVTDSEGEHDYAGLHTQISWYRSSLPGTAYEITLSYETIVDAGVNERGESSFSLGNIIWVNDREHKRIYDAVWGGGSIIKFDKNIVKRGDAPADDTFVTENGGEEGKYSIVREGDEVTYRLELENDGNAMFTLNGSDLADALPNTFNDAAGDLTFKWAKDKNVSIEIVNEDNGTKLAGMQDWTIGDSYGGLVSSYGQQYILWPKSSSIVFAPNSKVYIYVTLKFPSNTTGKTTWSNYVKQADGVTISNTLWVYRYQSVVTHNLGETGYALLQKGVYDTGAGNAYSHERIYYNNLDSRKRTATYYVTVLNAGSKRLYLNTIYDKLPKGFTFALVKSSAAANPNTATGTTNSITTIGGMAESGDAWPSSNSLVNATYAVDGVGQQISYRTASVTASTSGGLLKFDFGPGSGDYAVRYDEETEQYYLNRGEAILFAYTVNIGEVKATEPEATNVVGMPYSDYLSSNVVSAISDEAVDAGIEVDVHGYTNNSTYVEVNDDNTPLIVAGDQVDQDFVTAHPSKEDQWFTSAVTLKKGDIQPNVSKRASSYTDTTGNTVTDFETVPPEATVTWEIKAQNNGQQALLDYIVVDKLPEQFVYAGEVWNKNIYPGENAGASFSDAAALLYIPEHTSEDQKITVRPGDRRNDQWSCEVNLDQRDWYETYSDTFQFRLYRDEDGREVLELRFTNPSRALPENGGYSLITVDTKNTTGENYNKVYTNTASLLLGPDTWKDSEGNYPVFTPTTGTKVEDDGEGRVGVTNNAAINVAFGLATTARKRVTEVDNPENTAVSSDGEGANTVALSSEASTFDYTLEVDNTTGNSISQLVLIDSLPAIGDTSPFDEEAGRGSQYQVNFAQNPNVRVTVEMPAEEGGEGNASQPTVTDLDPKYFTVEYQKATTFTDKDWQGRPGSWSEKWSADVRSIRVVIGGEGVDYEIPQDAIVRVTFNAQAAEDATPGTLAWNNYGYHYAVVNGESTTELSALSLPVGVRVPTAPVLTKRVIDDEGQPVELENTQTFRFVVYTGGPVTGTYATDEELLNALQNTPDRNYRVFEVTVPAGASASEPVYLTKAYMDLLAHEGKSGWTWADDATYTIYELECPDGYEFGNINNEPDSAVDFKYDASQNIVLTATNQEVLWSITVNKVDGDNNTPLTGAVFALYSPNEADKLDEVPGEYGDLDIKLELEGIGGVTSAKGYLAGVVTIENANGSYTWTDLKRDRYYLLEVKAPDGYVMPDQPGQVIYRDQDAQTGVATITVANFGSFELPSTGGPGTTLFTLGGVALMGAACIAGYRKRSRKGDGPCC
ncbi:leucine-rich repeat protein [Enorma phocaeensis]|uniref:leucine-rich repeat protein n=1 Tax=Enorma phocaeensis TaxID=1871019 RepID=UPI00195D9E66|nr:leucine-rich repeat protein [Enorma phocaeensis]MBM6952892.1 leucine-rich repeat protein [Enorma phocaeensis]